MRKQTLMTALILASLLLSTTGAQAADPTTAPGESAETPLTWAPGTEVTWPNSGELWLSVPLEKGRSTGFAVPKATDIDLYMNRRPLPGRCAVAGDLTCTFLPSGTGGYLLRLIGPAGERVTPRFMDGNSQESAYEFGAIRGQQWAIPAAGSAFWQIQGPPEGSVWAFTVPMATKLTLWDGTTEVATATGNSLRFTAPEAATLTLEVEAPRIGYYGPSLWAEGTAAAAGFDWPVSSPKSLTIGATRTAWIKPSGLVPNRTTQLFVEGKASLTAQTTAGRFLQMPCDRTDSGSQCRLTVPEGESVALRVSGTTGTAVTLSAATGTTTSPYQITQWTGLQRPVQVEPSGTAALALTLPAGQLHLRVPGATHLSLTTAPAVTADGEWLTATIPSAGVYRLDVTAGPTGILQVQRYFPGELPQLAIPFDSVAKPFLVPIGARKSAWVKVNLEGGTTYQFQSSTAITAATTTGQIYPISARRQGDRFNLAFTPKSDGEYLIRLSGSSGSATLAMDGATLASPIPASPDLLSHVWAQAGSTVYLTLPIPTAGRWGISVPGAAALTLRDGDGTDYAGGDLLVYTATAPGSYTLAVKASTSGTYTPTLIEDGGIRALALNLPSSGLTTKIPATRSLWLTPTGLTAGARYTFKASGNPVVNFTDASERRVTAECGTAGTQRVCSVTVPADGRLWLQLIGPANLGTSLSFEVKS